MGRKPASEAPGTGLELAVISEGMVGLHKEYYGKGPTQAKTYAVNDTILCILKGGFTTAETAEIMGKGKTHFYDRRKTVDPDKPDYEAAVAGDRYDLKERKLIAGEKKAGDDDTSPKR